MRKTLDAVQPRTSVVRRERSEGIQTFRTELDEAASKARGRRSECASPWTRWHADGLSAPNERLAAVDDSDDVGGRPAHHDDRISGLITGIQALYRAIVVDLGDDHRRVPLQDQF